MGTYESTTTVTAAPDELFSYLSDVHNLPEYFAAMKSAERAGAAHGDAPAGAEAVHSVAVVNGQRAEGEARGLPWLLHACDVAEGQQESRDAHEIELR